MENKAVEFLEKLDSLATRYAPEVMDGALDVVRLSGLDDLRKSLILAVLAVVLWFSGERLHKWEDDNDFDGGFILFISRVLCLIASVIALIEVTSVVTWTKILAPKLAIIQKIIGV